MTDYIATQESIVPSFHQGQISPSPGKGSSDNLQLLLKRSSRDLHGKGSSGIEADDLHGKGSCCERSPECGDGAAPSQALAFSAIVVSVACGFLLCSSLFCDSPLFRPLLLWFLFSGKAVLSCWGFNQAELCLHSLSSATPRSLRRCSSITPLTTIHINYFTRSNISPPRYCHHPCSITLFLQSINMSTVAILCWFSFPLGSQYQMLLLDLDQDMFALPRIIFTTSA
ncbi:hypothetical protein KSP40_PGU019689 [Platanthera guangdongensis]|uniref:Uncharacterized protein n=1 Tax=Platanthera guangdongensis TaxID=2320717 RepID=A0ABR2LUM5_9ASPA